MDKTNKTCGCIFMNIDYEFEGVRYCSHCLIDKLNDEGIIKKTELLDGTNIVERKGD